MTKILLVISITLSYFISFGQMLHDNYNLNFEDSMGIQHITIDTISNPSNIWQIGTPQKTIFSNASSIPNAIVTDSIHPYPSNDTSIFIITNVVDGGGFSDPHTVILSGKYFVNSDTLTDFGTIEFSPDNGNIWLDLINDNLPLWWETPKPILTGNSNGWIDFYVNIAQLGLIYDIQMYDTTLYRFTFISDSVQANKDGLMFDDFHFEDWAEGIKEVQNDNLISIFPNPADEIVFIQKTIDSDNQSVQIFDYTGQVLYDEAHFIGETVDIQQFKNGIYLMKYSDTKNFSIKTFVVQH